MLVTGAGAMYERLIDGKGFTSINIGSGGNELYDGALTIADNSKKTIQNTVGYVQLVVNPLRLELSFFDLDNNLLDFVAL